MDGDLRRADLNLERHVRLISCQRTVKLLIVATPDEV
jgi:hypothetical protein